MDSDKLSREVTPEIIKELEDAIGKDNVNTNGEELLLYTHDLAPLPKMAGLAFDCVPDAVVRPSKVEDVAAVMKIAYRHGIAVVPRGASTWGMGGCMPVAGGIVLDMSSKMNKVIEINTEDMYVKVQAGITWKEVLDAVMEKGFIIGSYPSSFPAATVGAWMNTNGMGVGSYKYGSAKDNVRNLQVVLPDGTVIETGYDQMNSNMTGYNLNQFFAGSEGTLGVIATATMTIYPMGIMRPIAYEFETMQAMHPAIQALVRHPSIIPYHISWADSSHFAHQFQAGEHIPEGMKNILLVTLQGAQKNVEFEEAELDEIMASFNGVKKDDSVGEHEWEERCYEFRARRVGVGEIPAEVLIPVKHWGEFVEECVRGFDVMKMEMGGQVGNIVDRSTALFMPYYFKDDESMLGMTAFAYNFYMGDRAAAYGGRNTGLGVFFAWNLDIYHDADTVEFMRELKTFVDPHDVMNPGHVVCGQTRFGVNLSHGLMSFASELMQTVKRLLPENTTFQDNIERFRYNQLEEEKAADRKHVLGRGYD